MKSRDSFPKIAFLAPPLAEMAPSGVTTFVRHMVDGFGKHGENFKFVEISSGDHQLVTMAPPSSLTPHPSPLTLHPSRFTSHLLALSYIRQLGRDIRRVWRIRGQCRQRIIVTNEFGCETLPIALRVVFPFSRIIAISHTHPGNDRMANHLVRRAIERVCYWALSDILFNSAASRHEWARKLRLKVSKGKVIHLGTSMPDLTIPSDYPAREPGVVDFLCVARFVGWKGQMSLVKAWAMLTSQKVVSRFGDTVPLKARLILIGDGPCLDKVKKTAYEAGLGARVVFMGTRPNADRYFNMADVGVLLSSEPEAFGLSLLEAMSRGKPILASRIGGIPEIVEDGETGLLVQPGDCEKTAESVCQLTASAEMRKGFGERGRQRWDEAYSVERMVQRYEGYFMMRGSVRQ